VKAQYVLKFINQEYGFLDTDLLKGDFLEFFADTAKDKNHKWIMVYKHFHNFVSGSCTFKEITVDLCNKFREYLLNEAFDLRFGDQHLSKNSCAGYFATFRAMLKITFQERRIKENVNEFLTGIKWEDPDKAYLTMQELKRLSETPCDIPVLKMASIFACFTGLRISDVLNLCWENIEHLPDGKGYCMRITTQKTKHKATLPISDEALEWCGERGTGLVFKGLKRTMIYAPLRKWIAEAGIDKHITFHCLSHIANHYTLKINVLQLLLA
ncbi:MAG: site-specific integrase, partial [Rikenellaceae bacterium]